MATALCGEFAFDPVIRLPADLPGAPAPEQEDEEKDAGLPGAPAEEQEEKAAMASAVRERDGARIRLSLKHGATLEIITEYMHGLCSSLRRRNVLGLPDLRRPSTADIKECYRFVREVGRGHFGVVRLCEEKGCGATYACKSILKSSIKKEEDVRELCSEVISMLRLQQRLTSHESIVTLQEVFEDEASVHLVMDFCSGGDLFDHITHHKRLSEREAAHVLRQLVAAVRSMHASGLVHRDLKPENVLLTRPRSQSAKGHPDVKVADFGLCVVLEPGQQARGVAGSPFYMAPEVIRGKPYGPEVDVWSLGVILYTSLAGSLPFWGRGHEAVFAAVLRARPDFVKKPWPLVSPEAKHLIRSMLSPEAAKRITLEAVLSHPWLLHNCPDLQARHQHQQQQFQQHQHNPRLTSYQLGNYQLPHFIQVPQQWALPSQPPQQEPQQQQQEGEPQAQAQQRPGQQFQPASVLKQMISPLTGGTLFPTSLGAGFSEASPNVAADGSAPLSTAAVLPDTAMEDASPAADHVGPISAALDVGSVDPGNVHGAQQAASPKASQDDSGRGPSARRATAAPPPPPSVVPPHLVVAPPAGSKRYGSPTWLVQLAAHRVDQTNRDAAAASGAVHNGHHSSRVPVPGSHSEENLRAGGGGGGVPAVHQDRDRDLHMIPSPPRVAVDASPCSSPSLLHRVQAALSLAHPFPRLYMPFANSNYASPEMSPAQSRPLTPASQASPALSPQPSPGASPLQHRPPHSIFKDAAPQDMALYQRRGVSRPGSIAPARIVPPGCGTLSGNASGEGLTTLSTAGGTACGLMVPSGSGGKNSGSSDMDAEYTSQQASVSPGTQGVPRKDPSVVLLAPKAAFLDAGSVPTPKMFGVPKGKKGGPGGEEQEQEKENSLPSGAQQGGGGAGGGKASGYKKLSLFISSPSCLSPVGSVNMSSPCGSRVERSGSEESVSSAEPAPVTDTVTPQQPPPAKAPPAVPCAGDKGSKGSGFGLRNSLSPFALADSAVSALFSPGTSDRSH